MRLSGGVAILGEGPDPRDAESRTEETERTPAHEEIAGADAEPAKDGASSETPC